MLERICLQIWNGQLTLFKMHAILKFNTFWKFCQMKLLTKYQ